VAQSHTPCNRCVRFATAVANGHATLATKRRLPLTWVPDLGRTRTGWIAPACGWRTYSITWSARSRIAVGTVRPSGLAVLRLTIISTFTACCTGSSAGFAPLRMRPA
jgi:CubicO group peptidase (beta-lactamase class C family)